MHRDIKRGNILVTYEDGCVHLQIADLDTVAFAEEKNLRFRGTNGYFAPEVSPKLRNYQKIYQSADKKKLDIYALGITFYKILETALADADRIQKETKEASVKLIRSLIAENIDARFSIDGAMEDTFFGDTPEERQAYFKSILKKFERPDVFYDSYFQAPQDYYPELYDAFLLLPKALKEIYQLAANLNDTIKIFQQYATDLDQQELIKPTLYRQAIQLNKLISETEIDSPILIKLKTGAIQVLKALKKTSLEMMSVTDLKDIVSAAVEEYIKINHLNAPATHRFFDVFKKHNQAGKASARNLLTQINALEKPTPLAIFELIDIHLAKGKGAWGEQSFKTILAKKLGDVSDFPFDKWPSYLSKTTPAKEGEEKESKHSKRPTKL